MSAGRAASLVVKDLPKGVKPLLSSNQDEARLRVLSLYKAWMRQASAACKKQDLGISEETAKAKIRAEFAKNQAVQDLRVVDSLIKKGTLLLEETSLGCLLEELFASTMNEIINRLLATAEGQSLLANDDLNQLKEMYWQELDTLPVALTIDVYDSEVIITVHHKLREEPVICIEAYPGNPSWLHYFDRFEIPPDLYKKRFLEILPMICDGRALLCQINNHKPKVPGGGNAETQRIVLEPANRIPEPHNPFASVQEQQRQQDSLVPMNLDPTFSPKRLAFLFFLDNERNKWKSTALRRCKEVLIFGNPPGHQDNVTTPFTQVISHRSVQPAADEPSLRLGQGVSYVDHWRSQDMQSPISTDTLHSVATPVSITERLQKVEGTKRKRSESSSLDSDAMYSAAALPMPAATSSASVHFASATAAAPALSPSSAAHIGTATATVTAVSLPSTSAATVAGAATSAFLAPASGVAAAVGSGASAAPSDAATLMPVSCSATSAAAPTAASSASVVTSSADAAIASVTFSPGGDSLSPMPALSLSSALPTASSSSSVSSLSSSSMSLPAVLSKSRRTSAAPSAHPTLNRYSAVTSAASVKMEAVPAPCCASTTMPSVTTPTTTSSATSTRRLLPSRKVMKSSATTAAAATAGMSTNLTAAMSTNLTAAMSNNLTTAHRRPSSQTQVGFGLSADSNIQQELLLQAHKAEQQLRQSPQLEVYRQQLLAQHQHQQHQQQQQQQQHHQQQHQQQAPPPQQILEQVTAERRAQAQRNLQQRQQQNTVPRNSAAAAAVAATATSASLGELAAVSSPASSMHAATPPGLNTQSSSAVLPPVRPLSRSQPIVTGNATATAIPSSDDAITGAHTASSAASTPAQLTVVHPLQSSHQASHQAVSNPNLQALVDKYNAQQHSAHQQWAQAQQQQKHSQQQKQHQQQDQLQQQKQQQEHLQLIQKQQQEWLKHQHQLQKLQQMTRGQQMRTRSQQQQQQQQQRMSMLSPHQQLLLLRAKLNKPGLSPHEHQAAMLKWQHYQQQLKAIQQRATATGPSVRSQTLASSAGVASASNAMDISNVTATATPGRASTNSLLKNGAVTTTTIPTPNIKVAMTPSSISAMAAAGKPSSVLRTPPVTTSPQQQPNTSFLPPS